MAERYLVRAGGGSARRYGGIMTGMPEIRNAVTPDSTGQISVLYIDDEPGLLEIGKMFLEESGQIRVDTLPLASQAAERLVSSTYDAIVSDYQMPGMDGISFLKLLRARGSDIPFILFTGKGREEIVIEALNNGADFYLQKGGDPVAQFAELEHKIRLVVEQRRTKNLLAESLHRIDYIIDFLPDATLAISVDGTVIAWNRAIEELTGVRKQEILGTGNYSYALPFYGKRCPVLIDLVVCDCAGIEDRYQQIRKNGDRIVADVKIASCNGRNNVWLWATASPLYDSKGTVIGAIESIRDATERKKLETEVRQAGKKLGLLHELTTHDILSQLTALLGYLELSKAQLAGHDAIGYIDRSIFTANRIHTLIGFSRYYHDLGETEPAWHNISELCMRAASDRGEVSVTGPPGNFEVYADPLLGKVFGILFNKAICRGRHVTAITMACTADPGGDGITIAIEDDGDVAAGGPGDTIARDGKRTDADICFILARDILQITGMTIQKTVTGDAGARFEIHVPTGCYRFA